MIDRNMLDADQLRARHDWFWLKLVILLIVLMVIGALASFILGLLKVAAGAFVLIGGIFLVIGLVGVCIYAELRYRINRARFRHELRAHGIDPDSTGL